MLVLVTSAAVVVPFAPPLTIAFCVPPVKVASNANPLVVPILAVTVPSTVREPPLSVTATEVLVRLTSNA